MQITLATTYMAILTTGIILCFLTICLMHKGLLLRFGYKLLALFVTFAFLRFLLPFELPFTKIIALPAKISQIVLLCRHRLFFIGEQSVSIWLIFKYIWIIGAIAGITHNLITYRKAQYHITLYGKELTNSPAYRNLTDRICQETNHRNRFRIIEMPGLVIPMLFGTFSPKILVPEKFQIDDPQSYYVLRHEMTHHFHHDLILKFLINIITIIYWWNPLCKRLNDQTAVILEMHVDDSLTHSDSMKTVEYINCLVDYKTSTIEQPSLFDKFSISLIPKENSDLVKRSYMMMNNQKKSDLPMSILLTSVVFIVYLSSYLFIFEGYNTPSEKLMEIPDDVIHLDDIHVIDSTDSCLIDNRNGTYDLYFNGMYLETLDSLDAYNPVPPIYTPENNPYKDSTH